MRVVENIIPKYSISDIIKGHEKIIPFIAVGDSCSCAVVREVSKRVRKDYPNVSISAAVLKRCIERERENAAGAKCYPGIGYSVMKPRQDKPAMFAEQVQAIRDADFEGFTVFDYTLITATALLNQFDE